ncbi:unnamed protein product, partial [Discosporangium mesarthrocarpum]
MGVRLIDEFLAKSNIHSPGGCSDLRETADIISKVRNCESSHPDPLAPALCFPFCYQTRVCSPLLKYISFFAYTGLIQSVAFKMFLGVTADVGMWSNDASAFSLLLHDNPLI